MFGWVRKQEPERVAPTLPTVCPVCPVCRGPLTLGRQSAGPCRITYGGRMPGLDERRYYAIDCRTH